MRCTRCDTLNEDNARFCQSCGAAFEGTVPRYRVTHAPMTGPSCPSCLKRNPEGARYCVYCAAVLEQPSQAAYVASAAQPAPVGGAAAMAAPAQQFVLRVDDGGTLLV